MRMGWHGINLLSVSISIRCGPHCAPPCVHCDCLHRHWFLQQNPVGPGSLYIHTDWRWHCCTSSEIPGAKPYRCAVFGLLANNFNSFNICLGRLSIPRNLSWTRGTSSGKLPQSILKEVTVYLWGCLKMYRRLSWFDQSMTMFTCTQSVFCLHSKDIILTRLFTCMYVFDVWVRFLICCNVGWGPNTNAQRHGSTDQRCGVLQGPDWSHCYWSFAHNLFWWQHCSNHRYRKLNLGLQLTLIFTVS